jgi:hypothetical protein
VPIPVTSQFLPLSPQIASAWRMMLHCWCQHHSPRARDPRNVMYSWVPSERVKLPYTVENLGVHKKDARSRTLLDLYGQFDALFLHVVSEGVWIIPSNTHTNYHGSATRKSHEALEFNRKTAYPYPVCRSSTQPTSYLTD